jgi:hypothetical protein
MDKNIRQVLARTAWLDFGDLDRVLVGATPPRQRRFWSFEKSIAVCKLHLWRLFFTIIFRLTWYLLSAVWQPQIMYQSFETRSICGSCFTLIQSINKCQILPESTDLNRWTIRNAKKLTITPSSPKFYGYAHVIHMLLKTSPRSYTK